MKRTVWPRRLEARRKDDAEKANGRVLVGDFLGVDGLGFTVLVGGRKTVVVLRVWCVCVSAMAPLMPGQASSCLDSTRSRTPREYGS